MSVRRVEARFSGDPQVTVYTDYQGIFVYDLTAKAWSGRKPDSVTAKAIHAALAGVAKIAAPVRKTRPKAKPKAK